MIKFDNGEADNKGPIGCDFLEIKSFQKKKRPKI